MAFGTPKRTSSHVMAVRMSGTRHRGRMTQPPIQPSRQRRTAILQQTTQAIKSRPRQLTLLLPSLQNLVLHKTSAHLHCPIRNPSPSIQIYLRLHPHLHQALTCWPMRAPLTHQMQCWHRGYRRHGVWK